MERKELIVSERIIQMEESATLAMTKMGRELAEKGINVISLSVGEPDFFTPTFIKDAAKKAIDDNFSFYTPVPGYADLRKAIVNKLKRDNNLTFTPEQIVVSNGAKQSIANLLLSIINKDDEVIVLTPYWVSYTELIKLAEGKSVFVEAGIDNNFKVSGEQINKAITNKTKAIIFSSPCNPTGSVYSKEELYEIAQVVSQHPNIIVISDEIYEHIIFSGKHESIAQFDIMKDRVVVINGVSKAFAMPGWRIGYMAAPIEIAKACEKVQGQITSAPSSIAQKAALAAINNDPAEIKELNTMLIAFKERRNLVFELLSKIKGLKVNLPDGAFYIFADCSFYFQKSYKNWIIENDVDLCKYLLAEAHVALVPGSAFGDKNCFRLSYATSNEKLIEACKRITIALNNLA